MAEKEFLLDCFRKMLLIRRFEEKAAQAYQQGKFGGFCHLYIGQEAVAVGTEAALAKDDYFITAYRDHGHGLVRGISAKAAMAELFAKATGCSKGKGGSMHFFNTKDGFYGGWGIVGGQIPLGAGLAFASKYRGDKKVTIAFLGDGAMPQGVVYETFNMAVLWGLPLITVIENNQYAMGTPLERSNARPEDLYRRGEPFGVECSWIDGMDVQVVYDHFKKLVAEVRKDSKPRLVEIRTYRYRGHSMSDPIHGVYRTKEEVEEMKASDPVAKVAARLKEQFKVKESDLEKLDAAVVAECDEAVRFAEESPAPEPAALFEDIYA